MERWTGGLPGFQGTFNSCFQALRLVGLRFRAPIHLIPFFLLSEPAWLKALVALTLTWTVPSRHSATGTLGFAPRGGLLRPRAGHFVHSVLPNFKSRLVNPSVFCRKYLLLFEASAESQVASASISLLYMPTTTPSYCTVSKATSSSESQILGQPALGTVAASAQIFSNCLVYAELELRSIVRGVCYR